MKAAFYQDANNEWRPVPEPIALRIVVRAALLNALAYTGGDQQHAAMLLEITPRQMAYQMVTHSIPLAHHVRH
jgi:transcriptional regulator with GAF, ATPase, and Fis domain